MKAAIAIIVALVLIGGSVVGLAVAGVIDIPGLSPANPTAKKDDKASAPSKTEAKTASTESKTPAKDKKPSKTNQPALDTLTDPDVGAKSLAKLWNEMDSAKLADLVKDWKDADVASVFRKMDADKVAEVMAQLDAKRASKISSLFEKQASVVKIES
jgi:flagellar motility protein MotE (MotC chaperone)